LLLSPTRLRFWCQQLGKIVPLFDLLCVHKFIAGGVKINYSVT